MNLEELTEEIHFCIASKELVKSTAMVSWINQAIKRIFNKAISERVPLNEDKFSITFTTQEIIVDNSENRRNILRFLTAEDSTGFPVTIMTKKNSLRSNEPSIYWYRNNDNRGNSIVTMGLSIGAGGEAYTISYIKRPTLFEIDSPNDIEINEIPPEHHLTIVYMATVLILTAHPPEGKADKSDKWLGHFTDAFNDMIGTVGEEVDGVVDTDIN